MCNKLIRLTMVQAKGKPHFMGVGVAQATRVARLRSLCADLRQRLLDRERK